MTERKCRIAACSNGKKSIYLHHGAAAQQIDLQVIFFGSHACSVREGGR